MDNQLLSLNFLLSFCSRVMNETDTQMLSQSRDDKRSKRHVQFLIGVPLSEYLIYIIYLKANIKYVLNILMVRCL